MNVREIREEVAFLAIEQRASDVEDGPFWSALNRAIPVVNRMRPARKAIDIYNKKLATSLEITESMPFNRDRRIDLNAPSCAALIMKISGMCEVTIRHDGIEVERITVNQMARQSDLRRIISAYGKGEALDLTVTIESNYAGSLIAACFYTEKHSDEPYNIPDTGLYNIYDLKTLAADFSHGEYILYDEDNSCGERLCNSTDYVLYDGKELWLLKAKEGRYRVVYSPRFPLLTVDNKEDEIPINTELHPLLPLLVGYYVWLEDKPELAQAMYASYMQMAAEIKNDAKLADFPRMQDVYGW